MAHLTGLGFQNFRIFKDYQYIDLSPVTIFTGANNTGKSSIFKGLLLLKQSFLTSPFLNNLDFKEGNHHLGDFGDAVNNNVNGNENVIFSIPCSLFGKTNLVLKIILPSLQTNLDEPIINQLEIVEINDNTLEKRILMIKELKIKEEEKDEEKMHGHAIRQKFKYEFDLVWVREVSKEVLKIFQEGHLDYDIFENRTNFYPLKVEGFKKLMKSTSESIPIALEKLVERTDDDLNRIKDYEYFHLNNFNHSKDITIWQALEGFGFYQVSVNNHSLLNYIMNEWEELRITLMDLITKKVSHLSSVRGNLERVYLGSDNSFNKLVREFTMLGEINEFVLSFLQRWIKIMSNGVFSYVEITRNAKLNYSEVILKKDEDTEIGTRLIDLGYGISQIIAVLLRIVIEVSKNENKNATSSWEVRYFPHVILIEEPEANLHPKLQSELADLFIEAFNLFNTQFIIETHSEYLIRQFQIRVAENYKIEQDVKKRFSKEWLKIYYLKNDDEKILTNIKIDVDGQIDYEVFAKGFYGESDDLKLSLLNIQRKKFIEDYEIVKEQLKEKTEEFDNKITELEEELKIEVENSKEYKIKFEKLVLLKEEKENELNEIIRNKEQLIDEYAEKIEKTDYSKYVSGIENIIDKNKIDKNKTLKYLATAKYFLANLDISADFSPVVIQYGRAIEHELIRFIKDFKNTINGTAIHPNVTTWINNFDSEKRRLKTNLGSRRAFDHPTALSKNGGPISIDLTMLKGYVSGSQTDYKLGFMLYIFEFMYFISSNHNPSISHDYTSITLYREFDKYLNSLFSNYTNAQRFFINVRYFKDLRNTAAHTYDNPINKRDAIEYVNKVEDFFKCL